MSITISAQTSKNIDYEIYANKALKHALRAVQLAKILNVDQNNKPVRASLLDFLLNKQTYVICGPKEYGGAIKGHAFLGYLEYHCSAVLDELDQASESVQKEAKREFLKAHGLTRYEIDGKNLGEINNLHVAVWRSFKDRAIIAPTSGSFGIAAYETVEKLRKAEIRLTVFEKAKTINLLSEHEGGARAWAPDISTKVMSQDKIDVLKSVAARVNQPVMEWTVRDTRDHFALLDALYNGDYFCPTNPKSVNEVVALLQNVLSNICKTKDGIITIFAKSTEFAKMQQELFERIERGDAATVETLRNNGILFSRDGNDRTQLTVMEPISGGIYGLMLGRLRHLDVISENFETDFEKDPRPIGNRGPYCQRELDEIRSNPYRKHPIVNKDRTYEQPSVGATLAGAVVADSIIISAAKGEIRLTEANQKMLEALFPNIAIAIKNNQLPELKIYCAPHVSNIVIAKELGLIEQEYPNDGIAKNGLGTITKGEGPIDAIKASPRSTLSNHYTPATNPWIVVAQAVLFMHEVDVYGKNARFPEPAGAASLASCLKHHYDVGCRNPVRSGEEVSYSKLHLPDLVYSLIINGMDQKIFEEVLSIESPGKNPWAYIEQQAALHGGEEIEFVKELKKCFHMTEAQLLKQPSGKSGSTRGIQSFTFYDTGHNGMEKIKDKLLPQVLQNREERFAAMKKAKQWLPHCKVDAATLLVWSVWAADKSKPPLGASQGFGCSCS